MEGDGVEGNGGEGDGGERMIVKGGIKSVQVTFRM